VHLLDRLDKVGSQSISIMRIKDTHDPDDYRPKLPAAVDAVHCDNQVAALGRRRPHVRCEAGASVVQVLDQLGIHKLLLSVPSGHYLRLNCLTNKHPEVGRSQVAEADETLVLNQRKWMSHRHNEIDESVDGVILIGTRESLEAASHMWTLLLREDLLVLLKVLAEVMRVATPPHLILVVGFARLAHVHRLRVDATWSTVHSLLDEIEHL
jgi:hypothetical protein